MPRDKSKKESAKIKQVTCQSSSDESSDQENVVVKKHSRKPVEPEPKSESDADTTSEEDTSSEEESDEISMTSTDILVNDPLYFVLSKLLLTTDGKKNIADILEEINQKLSKSKI